MSTYQYYEFQAVDRPLTAKEQANLRAYSSRATITASRFAVDYAWGDFKGDAAEWMEKYFDAFLYLASWGTHELMLRLPRSVLPLETAQQYCAGELAAVRAKGDHVILEFRSENEGDQWIDEDNDTLSSLLPVRAELASGDLRALYLAWLACAQAGELSDEEVEPPCPPGLGQLSAALKTFADFLRLGDDLIAAAATGSPNLEATDDAALETWVAALPEAEKTSWLIRLISGTEAHLRGELLRRFRDSSAAQAPRAKPRTVGELLAAAQSHAEDRRREEAERAAREKARRDREAAEARERHLAALAKREAESWELVNGLIATKQPKKYDEAVVLLRDLRDVCTRAGRQNEASERIASLTAEHAKKPSLIDRFRKAELV